MWVVEKDHRELIGINNERFNVIPAKFLQQIVKYDQNKNEKQLKLVLKQLKLFIKTVYKREFLCQQKIVYW